MSMPLQATGRMEVFKGVDLALGHTKAWLFRPFEIGKWFCIGVIIFFDVLFGSGLNYTGNSYGGSGGNGGLGDIAQVWRTAETWVMAHFALIALGGLLVLTLIVVAWAALTYLSSRGQLMFVRATALRDSRIDTNWRAVKPHVMSLFWFRLILLMLGMLMGLVLVVVVYIILRGAIIPTAEYTGEPVAFMPLLMTLIPVAVFFAVLSVVLGLAMSLLRSFVVPIMIACDLPCTQAWGEFFRAASGNWFPIIGYILFNIVFHMIFGFASLLAGCLTCCLGFLPVLSHTILAPFYVFQRALPLYMLAMRDERYNLFMVPEGEVVPPLPVE